MPHKWLVLIAVACGTFMATLDSSIVNIALPTLTKVLGSSLEQVKWIVIVYLLVITCLLLPFGRLSDQYGRKPIFQLGFLVFTAGSALCGISPSERWLLVSRIIQGIGASMLMSNGPAIITAAFPLNERGKALGTLAMVVSCGLVTGPSLGGYLIEAFGWRSIFLINIPIGIIGVLFAQKFVPWNRGQRHPGKFDWPGVLVQTLLLLSFIAVMEPPVLSISGSAFFPASRAAMGLLTMVFVALFIKIESDAAQPIFDISLLNDKIFRNANLAGLLTFIAYAALSVMMPFFLEEVLKLSPQRAGIWMSAIPLTIFIVAPISGRLSDRLGSQIISTVGAAVAAAGYFFMAGVLGKGVYEHSTRIQIILALCTIGLATGLFQSPNNSAIMSSVPTHKLGVASALLATVRNLGLVTGTGLATNLFTWRFNTTHSFISSLHWVFFLGGVVAIGAAILSLTRGNPITALHPTLPPKTGSKSGLKKRGRSHGVET